MRILSLIVLAALLSTAVSAKRPPAKQETSFDKHVLFNGNLQVDVPGNIKKEREFFHYWDDCSQGGYTVLFSGECSKNSGMSMQVYVHDHISDPKHLHERYDPRKHCLKNAELLQDSTYFLGNKRYTVVATLAKPGAAQRRSTANYDLSYYIIADGRMLEFHYHYWDNDGHGLEYWQDMSHRIANSIHWLSGNWVTARR